MYSALIAGNDSRQIKEPKTMAAKKKTKSKSKKSSKAKKAKETATTASASLSGAWNQ